MHVFDSVYLVALTGWVGSILFFTFAVAPIVFKVLGPEAGGAFVRALFPRYFQWGAISGAVALPAAVAVPLCFPELRGPGVGVQALVILSAILITLYSGNVVTPAINAARDLGDPGEARFHRLHRRSVWLNGLVLVIGLGLIVAFAARRCPRTEGIIEPKPRRLGAESAAAITSRAMADVRGKHRLRR
jgi:hypothetical protein